MGTVWRVLCTMLDVITIRAVDDLAKGIQEIQGHEKEQIPVDWAKKMF